MFGRLFNSGTTTAKNVLRSADRRLPGNYSIASAVRTTSDCVNKFAFFTQTLIPVVPSIAMHIIVEATNRCLPEFLGSPDHAFLAQKFDQSVFIKAIKSTSAGKEYADGGHCYGLVLFWHYYLQQQKNFIVELNNLKQKCDAGEILSSRENLHLRMINQAQISQSQIDTFGYQSLNINPAIEIKTQHMPNKSEANPALIDLMTEALEQAVRSPGSLIEIAPKGQTGAHSIGLVAQNTADGRTIIRYFDPNYREAFFEYDQLTQLDIVNDLANLLLFSYQTSLTDSTSHSHLSRFINAFIIQATIHHQVKPSLAHLIAADIKLPDMPIFSEIDNLSLPTQSPN